MLRGSLIARPLRVAATNFITGFNNLRQRFGSAGKAGTTPQRYRILAACICVLALAGCSEDVSVPKPRTYPRVVYPTRAYKPFDASYCRFTFDMPVYTTVEQDTSFFDEKPTNPCWFDLVYPDFNARLHCSYYPIDRSNTFEKLRADAFKMADTHNVKAEFIEELPISKPDGTIGFVFDIEGPTASSFQFYLSDSTRHFMRGALYFNTQINTDSLGPVLEFVKVDVMHLINTFKWQ